jgi:hypothetical protein
MNLRETTICELSFDSASAANRLRVNPTEWTLLVTYIGSAKAVVLNAIAPMGLWPWAMGCLSNEFLENESRYIDSLRLSDSFYDELCSELTCTSLHRDTIRTDLFGRYMNYSHYGTKLDKRPFGKQFRGDWKAAYVLGRISATVPYDAEKKTIEYLNEMLLKFGEYAVRSAPPLSQLEPGYNYRREPFYEMLYGAVELGNINREVILKRLDSRIQMLMKGEPALPLASPYIGIFPTQIPRAIERLDFEVALLRCQLLLLELDPREYPNAMSSIKDWGKKISAGSNGFAQYTSEWLRSAEVIQKMIEEYIVKIVDRYPVLRATPFSYPDVN